MDIVFKFIYIELLGAHHEESDAPGRVYSLRIYGAPIDLAVELADRLGISQSTLSRILNKKMDISYEMAVRLIYCSWSQRRIMDQHSKRLQKVMKFLVQVQL